MKLYFKIAQPKSSKERLYKIEAEVNDMKTPGEAYVIINGKEYLVEIHYDA